MKTKDLIGDKVFDLGQEYGRMVDSLPHHELKTAIIDAIQDTCERYIQEKYVDTEDLHDVLFTVSIETLWK